jgi:hypothetical protein
VVPQQKIVDLSSGTTIEKAFLPVNYVEVVAVIAFVDHVIIGHGL